MTKLYLRFGISLGIFFLPMLVLATTDIFPNTPIKTQVVTKSGATIECCQADSLVFYGLPNETKTGSITFKVQYKGSGSFVVIITGSAFEKDNLLLDTEYQPDNSEIWYKAGKPFQISVASGQIKTIRFQVTSGSRISSQQAGEYSARLYFVVKPFFH